MIGRFQYNSGGLEFYYDTRASSTHAEVMRVEEKLWFVTLAKGSGSLEVFFFFS